MQMPGLRKYFMIIGPLLLLAVPVHSDNKPFLASLVHLTSIASTVPGNGDVNPYGVAVVPVSTGKLVAGDILVSNFNNQSNLQGTGTTIMQIGPAGFVGVFATVADSACPGGIGLSTALVALSSGFVVVGSLPTLDGSSSTAGAGCLMVLNGNGAVVLTLSGNGINGPWDMTALDMGTSAVLFVSNVLNGTVAAMGTVVNQGSVLRIVLNTPSGGAPSMMGTPTVIASTFPERTDPAALVIGPTGLGLAGNGTLYVADTLENRIAAIPNALTATTSAGDGMTVAQGGALDGPLGLAIAPNGDIITVNSNDGRIVETSPDGKQRHDRNVDISHTGNGAGTLFGLAITPSGGGVYLVNDGNNTLDLLQ
jgi:hypothetical protein